MHSNYFQYFLVPSGFEMSQRSVALRSTSAAVRELVCKRRLKHCFLPSRALRLSGVCLRPQPLGSTALRAFYSIEHKRHEPYSLLEQLRCENDVSLWKPFLVELKNACSEARSDVLEETTELFVALFENSESWDSEKQSMAGMILCELMQIMTSSLPSASVQTLDRAFRTIFPRPTSGDVATPTLAFEQEQIDACFDQYQKAVSIAAPPTQSTQMLTSLMDERSQWGCPTDVEDWNVVLISAPIFSPHELTSLDRIYSRMTTRGIFPNANTAYALMKHYSQQRQFSKVVELFHIFFPNMLEPEVNLRREIPQPLRPLAFTPSPLFPEPPQPQASQGANILWTSQRSSPVASPNSEVCLCLLEVLAGRRQVDKIMEVLGLMLDLSLPLTTQCFNYLFQAMQDEYPARLLESCFLMLDYQVEPPELLYELLPVAFARVSLSKEAKWHVFFQEFLPLSNNKAHVVDAIFAELRRRDSAHPQIFVLYRLLKEFPWFPSSSRALCMRSLFMRRQLREVLSCFAHATEEGLDVDPEVEKDLQLVLDRAILAPLSVRSPKMKEEITLHLSRYRQAKRHRLQMRSPDDGWILSDKVLNSHV
eukprot:gb/GEZN01002542.1/.p1 GENE.gb/GEZN01002542.1/~~gb/GEZN01002542.1/.p1  ORF type:complete len:593 (+),score=39.70 gb/GEZN01002542.1/:134-1912(+)